MWRSAASRYRRAVNAEGVFDPSRLFTLRTRPDFRRTVAYGLTALAALIAGHEVGGVHAPLSASGSSRPACCTPRWKPPRDR